MLKGYKVLVTHVSEMLQNLYGSVIITTNKSFDSWGDIFTDLLLASAIIDKIVHYFTVIHINGPILDYFTFLKVVNQNISRDLKK